MAEVSPEWERADWADFLTIDQYFFALSGGMADNKEDEKYIRERIWWGYNDRYREGIDIFESVDDGLRWLKNCNKLINLYDQSDTTQRLQTAELHRHLGEFEKAEEIIKSVKAVDLEEVKAKMIEACGRKDRKVMRII
jgi:hypothetical protein